MNFDLLLKRLRPSVKIMEILIKFLGITILATYKENVNKEVLFYEVRITQQRILCIVLQSFEKGN